MSISSIFLKSLKIKRTPLKKTKFSRSEQSQKQIQDLKADLRRQVGCCITQFRREQLLSQSDFGNPLLLHQTAVSRIESGLQSLSVEELFLAEEYFGLNLDRS